jgi:hypothetical protein
MVRKKRFPPEHDTRPDLKRAKVATTHHSGPAPKSVRMRAEAETIPPPSEPPPPTKRSGRPAPKTERRPRVSDVREVERGPHAATVDEVTADMSKDPRREKDE